MSYPKRIPGPMTAATLLALYVHGKMQMTYAEIDECVDVLIGLLEDVREVQNPKIEHWDVPAREDD